MIGRLNLNLGIGRGVLALPISIFLFWAGLAAALSAAETARIPWTSSRVLGSPEAPLPYESARVYPGLAFDNPTELDFLPDGSYGLVIERTAHLLAFPNRPDAAETFLVADLNLGRDGRTEAYAIVFDPGFTSNRLVYVSMTLRRAGEALMKVSRFPMSELDPPRLDLSNELTIIEWPSGGHNGCDLHFGLDGYLYASAGDGDGPAPPDPRQTGQDLDDLLSTVFRVDVREARAEQPYRVPPDNPFVNQPGARAEIWAYGFRNPWKTCIDPRDGSLWVGDVGWENWELVFRVDRGGFNGGWSAVEGPQNVHVNWPRGPTPIRPPLRVHSHTEATSITGGRIYRGSRFPELRDAYIYGDWGTGRLWALRFADGQIQAQWELALTSQRVVAFAEDQERELYFIDNAGGAIYQLRPHHAPTSPYPFPTRLSETGLYSSTADHALAPGVYPYGIAAPMWSDHASVERALALPNDSQLAPADDLFEVPTNAVFVRTLSLEMDQGRPATRRRIETQLLHFDGLIFNGYTYRWREDQRDADLVEKTGQEASWRVRDDRFPQGFRDQTWRFLSRSECGRCHINRYNSRFGNLTGLVPEQLISLAGTTYPTEWDRLSYLGLIADGRAPRLSHRLVNPYDDSAPLEKRARSWLHANCAHCHRRDGGGAVVMYLQNHLSLEEMAVVNEPAVRGTFDLTEPRRVNPGRPFHSTLLYRILTTSTGRMPIIGSTTVDDVGARLVRDWILSLPAKDPAPPNDDRILDNEIFDRVAQWRGTTDGGMKLAMAAADPSLAQDVRQRLVGEGLAGGHPATRDLLERFLPLEQRRQVLGTAPSAERILARSGDAAAGRQLFFSPTGPQCSTCHRLLGEGRAFGPSLEQIGSKYDRPALLAQILHPSEIIEPAWQPFVVDRHDGESYTGFILERSENEVRLQSAADLQVSWPAAAVKSIRKLDSSLMPEGLLQSTTAQEAADLLAFLGSLRGSD